MKLAYHCGLYRRLKVESRAQKSVGILLGQNPPTAVVGLDDLAEGNREVLGFAALAIDQEQVPKLEQAAKSLLVRSGMPEFHGSDFRPQYETYYDDFLAAIAEAMESSRHSGVLVRYQSAPRFRSNLNLGEQLLSSSILTKLSKPDAALLNALTECSGWLTVLAHSWMDIAPSAASAQVEMDSDTSKEGLKAQVALEGILMDGQRVVTVWHNAMCSVLARKGLTTCRLARFRIADSMDSVIVQAADVLGNFSLSHLRLILGCEPGDLARNKIRLLTKHFNPELPGSISDWTCTGGKLSPGTSAQDFVLRISGG
jgi:hypothetical protein